jgi:hypothetical protein
LVGALRKGGNWFFTLKVDKVGQGAVHVHHDPYLPHEQGQAHVKVQESHEAHQIDQHEQEFILDALRSA